MIEKSDLPLLLSNLYIDRVNKINGEEKPSLEVIGLITVLKALDGIMIVIKNIEKN